MKDKKLHQSDLSVIAGVGYFENIPAKEAPSGWTLGIVKLPDEQILVSDYKAHRIWRIDQKGILHSKQFYDLTKMNNIQISELQTSDTFRKNTFLSNFLTSVRQKINDPIILKKEIRL